VTAAPGHTLTDEHTLGRAALDEGSAGRRDLYLTTHNTHTRQASVLLAGDIVIAF